MTHTRYFKGQRSACHAIYSKFVLDEQGEILQIYAIRINDLTGAGWYYNEDIDDPSINLWEIQNASTEQEFELALAQARANPEPS